MLTFTRNPPNSLIFDIHRNALSTTPFCRHTFVGYLNMQNKTLVPFGTFTFEELKQVVDMLGEPYDEHLK